MSRPPTRFVRPVLALALPLLATAGSARAGLTHRYSFDDGTANDSVGTAHGVVVNGAPVAGGRIDFNANTGQPAQSLSTAQYVDLPNQIARTPALTLETWATYRGGGVFQQIASFGTGTAGEIQPGQAVPPYLGREYVALIPAAGVSSGSPTSGTAWGTIRSEIPPSGAPREEAVASPGALALNREYHIAYAVDYPNRTAALYLDGVEAARRDITLDPSQHDQVNNWLGRSQWSPDPFFRGAVNEFRVYDHALTPAEAAASFTRGPGAVPEPATPAAFALAGALLLLRRR